MTTLSPDSALLHGAGTTLPRRGCCEYAGWELASEVQRNVAVHRLAFRDEARLILREPLLDAQADAVPDSFVVRREPRQQLLRRAGPPGDVLRKALARLGEEARRLLGIR